MTHDVAGCALLACELCDAYGSGWAAGKDKLAFEVEAVKDNPSRCRLRLPAMRPGARRPGGGHRAGSLVRSGSARRPPVRLRGAGLRRYVRLLVSRP